jgi:hypothetical protein
MLKTGSILTLVVIACAAPQVSAAPPVDSGTGQARGPAAFGQPLVLRDMLVPSRVDRVATKLGLGRFVARANQKLDDRVPSLYPAQLAAGEVPFFHGESVAIGIHFDRRSNDGRNEKGEMLGLEFPAGPSGPGKLVVKSFLTEDGVGVDPGRPPRPATRADLERMGIKGQADFEANAITSFMRAWRTPHFFFWPTHYSRDPQDRARERETLLRNVDLIIEKKSASSPADFASWIANHRF